MNSGNVKVRMLALVALVIGALIYLLPTWAPSWLPLPEALSKSPIRLGLDLRDGGSCADRAATVDRLRKLRDPRAIPILRTARDERAGWFGRQYKHWCIRAQIVEALKELQSLPAPATQPR